MLAPGNKKGEREIARDKERERDRELPTDRQTGRPGVWQMFTF